MIVILADLPSKKGVRSKREYSGEAQTSCSSFLRRSGDLDAPQFSHVSCLKETFMARYFVFSTGGRKRKGYPSHHNLPESVRTMQEEMQHRSVGHRVSTLPWSALND